MEKEHIRQIMRKLEEAAQIAHEYDMRELARSIRELADKASGY